MLRTADLNETKPWQTCDLCSEKKIFRTPNDFSAHLRQTHCTKEGGSFVCRYGRNGVCPSLPVEGVSDRDYEAHVIKSHLRLEKDSLDKAVTYSSPKDDFLYARPRFPAITFTEADNFTVFSSTQNLQAVLNDPKYHKKQADFFTRTWGEEFVPHSVPPLTLLHAVPMGYYDEYLKKIEMRIRLHAKLKKSLVASNTAVPGDTGFTAAAAAAARRHTCISHDKSSSDLNVIPKVFMNPHFTLEDPETFSSVLPWSLVTADSSQAAQDRAGLMNAPRNSAKLLQEKLSHYLDIIEMNLAYQISLRSEDFFSAMASQDQLQDHVGQTIKEIKHLRMKIHKVSEVLCHGDLNLLRKQSLRSKYLSVYDKLKLMATVHQTQPTIQLLLSTSDFVGALDLISTTQEVLQQELAGVQSFRHLGSQLAEMERVIEKMMEADFADFVTANLNRCTDEVDHGCLIDEDRLVSVLFGLLHKHKFQFIHLYREEAFSTIKSTIKQTVQGFVMRNSEPDEESPRLAEAMRGLDFEQWMDMLQNVFDAALQVLRRMKVLHRSIAGVLAIAAGHCGPNSPIETYELMTEEIRQDAENIQAACDFDVLITRSEFDKLSNESRELLCASCEMAQVRCAKLINIRAKAGYLDSLTSTEFVNLTRMVEDFVGDCEGMCGRQSHSLRATLLSQAKKFIERFHEERKNKLGLILDNERWKQADVPAEFQALVDSLVDGVRPRGKEPTFAISSSNAQPDRGPASFLVVNGEKFTVVGTVLLLLKMVVEYCQCVDDTPMLVTDIMNKLFEVLKLFNSRTCQLVLGAGALQLVGLKTITVKHLALASRCLEMMTIYIPVFKSHFEERLPPKQYILLSQFDQILRDYSNHRQELIGKIVNLMEDVFNSHLARWEVRAPMPSQAMRGIVRQIIKLHESLSAILPSKQIEVMFREVKRIFKTCLAEKIEKLGVSNNGGPQHGLVTSDLAFFAESLRTLDGLVDVDKGLQDVWRLVNEIRNNRGSPGVARKSSTYR
ncbi:vacuolar protein sorting-associated protein 54 [Nematostella vectensis]|uniref:vacuolar protein sorting-associated protein 54 n=1 Tax=Nematostella vectensis TaxID=45351 RepID=UPI002076F37C|nr:vacuolar protein sorting-associated protein 54 [Nematostella vectensis]